MTVIAAIKNKNGKILMAGDRKLTFNWSLATTMPGPKVKKFEEEGLLIGACGSGNLCTVVIDLVSYPSMEKEDTSVYMNFKFKKELLKGLLIAGYKDEHSRLQIPAEYSCGVLVAIDGRLYQVDISHPDFDVPHGNILSGLIEIEEMSLPFAIGCGGDAAYPILLAEAKRRGYNTKDDLKLAMEIAADISPGVDRYCDIIQES